MQEHSSDRAATLLLLLHHHHCIMDYLCLSLSDLVRCRINLATHYSLIPIKPLTKPAASKHERAWWWISSFRWKKAIVWGPSSTIYLYIWWINYPNDLPTIILFVSRHQITSFILRNQSIESLFWWFSGRPLGSSTKNYVGFDSVV